MGAMSRQDGLEVVVEAADELVRRLERTDVTLALVGPGDVNEAIEAEVRRRGLEGVVVLTGPVDDDGVRAYLATADVCVNVDVPNPMNDRAAMRKVLEYLAAGRAVVQFPLTEMQRLCGDATEYARPGDARDLADRIALLLDDPERRRNLESRARRRVEEMGLLWPHQVPAFLSAVELAVRRATGLRRSGGP
jgi:glycosyltransferase involved in cell wall biosynthesis